MKRMNSSHPYELLTIQPRMAACDDWFVLPFFNRGVFALVALLVAACAPVGPDYRKPEMAIPKGFSNIPVNAAQPSKTESYWWRGFKDNTLNWLILEGYHANLYLREATANVQQAKALRFENQFDLYPTVTTSASQQYLQRSQGIFGQRFDGFNLLNVGFDATWELDFFGRIRRSIEARTNEVEALEAQRYAVMVILSAEIARNYFELRGTQNQLAVARKNAENQAATLKFTQARLRGGVGTALDTARAEGQLNTTLATIPPLETNIRANIHRIAVLLGKTPDSLYDKLLAAQALPGIPAIIGIENPAALLRRRPDIAFAERTLAATTAKIGIVTADLFPRVTFNGNVALEAQDFAGLGAAGGNTYSFGPTIQWAAFNLGRVQAQIKAVEAERLADLAAYERSVLLALEETENSLVNYGQLLQRLQYFREAVKAAEKATHLARLRYQDGVSDFLAVLDAERRLLESQDQLAQTETRTATSVVAVYKALGGGWY
jgi:outer membrane protein, multidrug efflux system